MLNYSLQNITNVGREVYLFNRQVDGSLTIQKDCTFYPYFYQLSATGIFRTIDNKKANKVFCKLPADVARQRNEESYEADVLFCKRYLIDKIDRIEKSNTKYLFIDIEIQAEKGIPNYIYPNQAITCISVYNNHENQGRTWFIKDSDEETVLKNFVKYVQDQKPDLLLGWNFVNFDYPYLAARIKKLWNLELAELISPIQKTRYGSKEVDISYPAGISILDYMDLFKKIYRTELSYSLDNISQKYLQTEANKKFDFSKITDDIRDKNIEDVKKLALLEKKLKIINFFDEIRRLTGCLWEDVTWHSRSLDVMLLKEAKKMGLVLPSRKHEIDTDEIEFEGAYRHADLGRFSNVYKLDLSSAYPQAIINFCLDTSNIADNGLKVSITDRETNEQKTEVFFKQNANALLPTIARKLIAQKDILKKTLKSLDPESQEAKDLQIKYDAIKALVNSLFGVTALKVFRLYDVRVASAITSIIRDLLHYVEDTLSKKGMKVTYADTDSVFVLGNDNPADYLNNLVQQWAKEIYNKDSVDIRFDCEGVFESILVIALCHYKGRLRTKSGLKIEEKGIEAKRKDSSKFMAEFQTKLIDKILDGDSQEAIVAFIKAEIEEIKHRPLKEVAFPFKLNNKDYKSPPIFVRAIEYTKELSATFDPVSGEVYYYVYVKSLGQATRKASRMQKNKETGIREVKKSETEVEKNVLAFDGEHIEYITQVDWDKMIDRNVLDKCEHIFEALQWDFAQLKEAKVKKIKKVKTADLIEEVRTQNPIDEDKCLVKENVLPKVDITKNETFNISHSFKTKADITGRTIMVAEAFGLGIDDEKTFQIYDQLELKVKPGDIIYVTGDSGSGKSWILNNVFAKMPNSISINELKIDENEVVVEGVGKDLNDALMKLNIAGLGDAFLYLRKYCQLSDGQKYRYRIAKFIDQEDKDVWLLDEFCATLDRTTAKIVAYNLQKIARKLSKTVIVATTHTDLFEEIRPSVQIVKGYESDVVVNYISSDYWKDKPLEMYRDIKVEIGAKEDYEKLKKFHYRQASLGALKAIYRCTYQNDLVGVIVITYPHLALKGRNIYMNNKYAKMSKENCSALNNECECIARVIVHPKYRGMGLSQFMLKEYFKLTNIVYTETLAVMANYNPFFEKAGMTRVNVEEDVKRQTMIDQLDVYGFNTSLVASKRYFDSIFTKLNAKQQEEVKEIVINILDKYKGQIVSLQKIDFKENWKEHVKHIVRANTVYLVKKLK